MAQAPVVGPVLVDGTWTFFCSECEADAITAQGENAPTAGCVTDWLTGQQLQLAAVFGERVCFCFESDPYENEEVEDRTRRFFYYRTIASLLGAVGRRVNLPRCVKAKIEQQHGRSEVSFQTS